MSWPTVPLASVVTTYGGGTPSRSRPEYFGGAIPWVTPKDMKTREILGSQMTLTEAGVANSATRLIPSNSVLLVIRSGVLKHRLPVGITRVPVTVNQDMKAFVPSAVLDAGYLARLLDAWSHRVLGWVRATTADNFPIARLHELEIPLPPLDRQRRISRVLDMADALREQRRGVLARLQALSASLFDEMFGDAGGGGGDWPVGPVSEFVSGVAGGRSFAGLDDEDGHSRHRVLRVSAVTSGQFRPEESRPVPDDYDPPSAHIVGDGDLLFSRANTSELVGAVALVRSPPANLLLPDKIWRFEWRDRERVSPEYVWQLFRSPALRRAVSRRATGTSGSMKNISAEKLLSIPVIQPPATEQVRFAERFRCIASLENRSSGELDYLNTLFASLQSRAFAGEL